MRNFLLGILLVLSGALTVQAAEGDFEQIRSLAGWNSCNGVEDPLKVPLGNLGSGDKIAYPWKPHYIDRN